MGLPGCELDGQVLWDAVLLVGEGRSSSASGSDRIADAVGTTWTVGLF